MLHFVQYSYMLYSKEILKLQKLFQIYIIYFYHFVIQTLYCSFNIARFTGSAYIGIMYHTLNIFEDHQKLSQTEPSGCCNVNTLNYKTIISVVSLCLSCAFIFRFIFRICVIQKRKSTIMTKCPLKVEVLFLHLNKSLTRVLSVSSCF